MSYPNILFGPEGLQYKQSTNARHALGQLLVLEDGRRFRYAKFGATAAPNAGLLFQSATFSSQFLNSTGLTAEALAVGGKTITFTTNIATALAAGVFNEGYAVAKTTSANGGGGNLLKIASHDAWSSGASTLHTLTLAYGAPAAVTSSVSWVLYQNPYSGVIIHPSPPTNNVVGWTMSSVVASNYSWLGTAGPVGALIDMDPQIFEGVTPSTGLDGAVSQAFLRLQSGDASTAWTSGGASALTPIENSTGLASAAYLLAGSTAQATAADLHIDVGMQQIVVGYAMSSGLASATYAAIFATLDG